MLPLWQLKAMRGGAASISVGDVYVGGGGDLRTQARMAAGEVERRILTSGRSRGVFGAAARGGIR